MYVAANLLDGRVHVLEPDGRVCVLEPDERLGVTEREKE